MTYIKFLRKITKMIPDVRVTETKNGEIVIYTGLKREKKCDHALIESGDIVSMSFETVKSGILTVVWCTRCGALKNPVTETWDLSDCNLVGVK